MAIGKPGHLFASGISAAEQSIHCFVDIAGSRCRCHDCQKTSIIYYYLHTVAPAVPPNNKILNEE